MITLFFKVNLYPHHCVSFEEWTRRIIRNTNKGDKYLMEREFLGFDAMPLVWRKLISEKRRFIIGYIDNMNQCVGRNYWVWTRDTLEYLVKYVLLK